MVVIGGGNEWLVVGMGKEENRGGGQCGGGGGVGDGDGEGEGVLFFFLKNIQENKKR